MDAVPLCSSKIVWPVGSKRAEPSDNTRSDEARAQRILLAQCRAGESAAFETLLRRYRERVFNLAYQLLRQREDAEDVAQETFARAFASIHQFRGEAELFTWLYRITLNQCAHRRRRARPFPEPVSENETQTPCVQARVETKINVEYALDQLSPPLRVVLILREMHDLSYQEIAAVLKIPIGTVRSRLNAAREQFRAVWETLQ